MATDSSRQDSPEAGPRLTCESCFRAPATRLAVMARDARQDTPGHLLRLLCEGCADWTRGICGQGGRAVTFLMVGDAGEAAVLLPAERIALTVARAQVGRGEAPPVNTATMLVMTLDRLTGEGRD